MAFRFRKRIRIAKGVHLNLSSRGVSTSIGGKGMTVNVGRRGVRTTLGIPGTGISQTFATSQRQARQTIEPAADVPPKPRRSLVSNLMWLFVVGLVLAFVFA